jgi:hypothetical protein
LAMADWSEWREYSLLCLYSRKMPWHPATFFDFKRCRWASVNSWKKNYSPCSLVFAAVGGAMEGGA